ncbi:MAG: hypothetical protein ACRDRJ_37750, partial [Streptosporangiaceae bacterium]
MTSASDRTDDRIIVSPADEDEDVADAQVIHGSIVHDDERDEAGADDERAGYDPLHAGPSEDDEAEDEPPWRMRSAADQTPEEAGPGHEPRRAWIPETPVSGAGGPSQPIAARSVPAQRAPFEAEPDEAEPDESDSDESVAEVPEPSPSAASQPVASQSASIQSAPSQPSVAPTDPDPTAAGLTGSGLTGSDQAEPDESELDELAPVEPVSSQPVPSQPAGAGSAAGLTEPSLTEPGLTEPGLTEPGLTEPSLTEPGLSESGKAEPGRPEPASDSPWPAIQSMFVDDPRRAVEQAAKVTSTALADLITAAKEQERTLRSDWQPDRTGTEELRVALRGYRDLAGRIATL